MPVSSPQSRLSQVRVLYVLKKYLSNLRKILGYKNTKTPRDSRGFRRIYIKSIRDGGDNRTRTCDLMRVKHAL